MGSQPKSETEAVRHVAAPVGLASARRGSAGEQTTATGEDPTTLRATRDRLEHESRVLEEEISRLQVRADALLEKWCSVDKVLHKAESVRYDKLKVKAIQASYTYRITALILRVIGLPRAVLRRLTGMG